MISAVYRKIVHLSRVSMAARLRISYQTHRTPDVIRPVDRMSGVSRPDNRTPDASPLDDEVLYNTLHGEFEQMDEFEEEIYDLLPTDQVKECKKSPAPVIAKQESISDRDLKKIAEANKRMIKNRAAEIVRAKILSASPLPPAKHSTTILDPQPSELLHSAPKVPRSAPVKKPLATQSSKLQRLDAKCQTKPKQSPSIEILPVELPTSAPSPPPDNSCVVCYEVDREVALITCGHYIMCGACVKKFNKCPVCTVSYSTPKDVLKIFN